MLPTAPMRIGVVPYSNALPLTFQLEGPLVFGTPAELEAKIHSGELDLALLPVMSLFGNPQLIGHFDCGVIQSSGLVESVGLFSKSPLPFTQEWGTNRVPRVWLTPDSVTSIALFQVLAHRHWGFRFAITPDRESADAVLLIGDEALLHARTPPWHYLDLGRGWQDFTGLPFIYATWVSRGPLSREFRVRLIAARELGTQSIDKIINLNQNIDHNLLRRYLMQSIRYFAGATSLQGLDLFHQYCRELDLVARGEREAS